MAPRLPRPIPALATIVWLLVTGCEPGPGPSMRFLAETPHQRYQAMLHEGGLDATALGRDWIAAGEAALAVPVDVDAPHEEALYLDPGRAPAVAYRMELARGQRLVARLTPSDTAQRRTRFFLDLFFTADTLTPLRFVAAAESTGRALEYVALRPGIYVLRIQPELLRGGRVTFSLTTRASLGFPVVGRDMANIRSRFGAPRDGGRREHHGVDIFAPRGTPVVAAAAGRVSRVSESGLGGKVVWLREADLDRRLYYAHLDRQAVVEGTWVEPGDTLGFVGNTGNARTTPPHLHFGIYMRGVGPVDPHFHLHDPPQNAARFAGDSAVVGTWARLGGRGAALRSRPRRDAPSMVAVDAYTPVELLAGAGEWYRARLPDGREGYVPVRDTEGLTSLGEVRAVASSLLRGPTLGGASLDSLEDGETVPVLGRFGGYALVERTPGRPGWISGGVLAEPAERRRAADRGAAGGR